MPPAFRRLSQSPLWAAQRRFYERVGIDAWRTATVPHHVTNNVALATAYARIVLGLLRESSEPLQVLELGAGAGRFAFLFLRALDALRPGAPVRYAMTDVAPSTIAFWRRHPALAPFVRAGRLDFGRFDADRDDRVRLERARRTIGPSTPAGRLVVIANYVFSGLPQDAFVVRGGRLREYLAETRLPRGGRADRVAFAWRVGGATTTPYGDEALDALAHAHATRRPRGPRLFPIGALRALGRLEALSQRPPLVLAADRAEVAGFGLGRHGAVSFPVSFTALTAWTLERGGQALHPPRRPRHIDIAGFVMGARGPRISRAYEHALAAGGPDALYGERRRLAGRASPVDPSALLSLIRRSGHDPRVVAECVRPIWPHLAGATPRLRRDIRRAVLAAWAGYYHLAEPHDVPFDLGLLLYAVRAYGDARTLFQASLRLYGEDASVRWNLALCHVALGNASSAHASFRRARTLAPDLHPVGLATLKSTELRC